MDWSAVDYLWIIVMFLSAVWTLILTAPIHCRASIAETLMKYYISPMIKKQTHHFQHIFMFGWTIPLKALEVSIGLWFYVGSYNTTTCLCKSCVHISAVLYCLEISSPNSSTASTNLSSSFEDWIFAGLVPLLRKLNLDSGWRYIMTWHCP